MNLATHPTTLLFQRVCFKALEYLPDYSITVDAGFALVFRDPESPTYLFRPAGESGMVIQVRDRSGLTVQQTYPEVLRNPMWTAMELLVNLRTGLVTE